MLTKTTRSTPAHALDRSTPSRPGRPRRSRVLIAGSALALAGIVGTGFSIQAAVAAQAETEAQAQSSGEHAAHLAERHVMEVRAATTRAEIAVDAATPVIAAAEGKADASALAASVAALDDHVALAPPRVFTLATQVDAGVAEVQAAIAEADRIAAEAAAARTPAGAQAIARDLAAARYGWGADQVGCLVKLWQKESGWRYDALNASSGAAGIPQSLPGSKMATHGADWQTNPATQISWGLDYIDRAYGTPCSAWGHSQSSNWY